MIDNIERGKWKGRSLENYIEMHRNNAKEKFKDNLSMYEAFLNARTLTKAKKILKGT